MKLTKLACLGLVLSMTGGCGDKPPRIHWYTDGTPHEDLTKCLQLAERAADPERARTDCLNAVPRSRGDR